MIKDIVIFQPISLINQLNVQLVGGSSLVNSAKTRKNQYITIYNYKKTDWEKIKHESSKFNDIFFKEYTNKKYRKKLEEVQTHKYNHGQICPFKMHKYKKQPSMTTYKTYKNDKKKT